MTDDTEEQSDLTLEQRQRAEALAVARAVLVDSSRTPLSGSETLPKRFATQDLIDVAQWVLDGTDPLAEYRRTSDGDDASVSTTSESMPPEAFGETGESAYPADPSLDASVAYAQSVARSMGDDEKPARHMVEDFQDGQE